MRDFLFSTTTKNEIFAPISEEYKPKRNAQLLPTPENRQSFRRTLCSGGILVAISLPSPLRRKIPLSRKKVLNPARHSTASGASSRSFLGMAHKGISQKTA